VQLLFLVELIHMTKALLFVCCPFILIFVVYLLHFTVLHCPFWFWNIVGKLPDVGMSRHLSCMDCV